jgi:predicted amidophosphoribosyltransferase
MPVPADLCRPICAGRFVPADLCRAICAGRSASSDSFEEAPVLHPAAPAERCWLCSACGQAAATADVLSRAGGEARLRCRNSWCGADDRPVDAIFAVGNYQGAFRKAIVAYKYGRDLRWARPFALLLYRFLQRRATWFEEYGTICPVPSFLGRDARRCWGHVELVCAELGWLANGEWPVESLVTKVFETEPMSGKARPARHQLARTSLPDAFFVADRAATEGRRILLVDDVCASGWTLLTVGRALRRAGASEVAALVLARARWRPPAGAGAAGAESGPARPGTARLDGSARRLDSPG